MHVELTTVKRKLTKNILSQFDLAGYDEFMKGEVLGYVTVAGPQFTSMTFVILYNGRYYKMHNFDEITHVYDAYEDDYDCVLSGRLKKVSSNRVVKYVETKIVGRKKGDAIYKKISELRLKAKSGKLEHIYVC